MGNSTTLLTLNPHSLVKQIKFIGHDIGFTDVRIAHPETARAANLLKRWQQLDNAGDMHYLQRHGLKRGHINTITKDCLSLISVSLNYLPISVAGAKLALDNQQPYISVYARNRDYHKIMRKMLTRFAAEIEKLLDKQLAYRAFVDTAPVLDKAYAEQSGIGWMGKHTNVLDRHHGSFYFLGELALNVKLPKDLPVKPRCGSCTACIDVCPTKAITAPYQLDAEKCISYLTIEYDGIISDEFKLAIGNRIYGCDDCQLFCPWNKYARQTLLKDFHTREVFMPSEYLKFLSWDETEFLKNTEGSPIRRIGHGRWQRNVAIGIGNTLRTQLILPKAIQALKNCLLTALTLQTHAGAIDALQWAINQTSNENE